jgi:hypothetical protein
VSGAYHENTQSSYVDCKDDRFLLWGGTSGSITVTQTGSDLTLGDVASMQGILHSDGSASFGPAPSNALPVDGDGNPEPTGTPEPGQLFLNGWFGTGNFIGTYVFIASVDGCEIDSKVQWISAN